MAATDGADKAGVCECVCGWKKREEGEKRGKERDENAADGGGGTWIDTNYTHVVWSEGNV